LVVAFDPARVTIAQIGGWLGRAHATSTKAPTREASAPGLAPLVCGAAALGLGLAGAPVLLTAGFLAVSAVPIFLRACESLLGERRVSADVLDATAVAVLAARGGFVPAALSAGLIAGGEYIRGLTARRSRRALVGLLSLTSGQVWVVRGKQKERLPAEALAAGDTVVVYPGEQVLVDGVVIRGRGLVDQKVLTGESKPVLKQVGDPVYAATLLTEGKLYVRTERVGGTTRASRIVQILEGAPIHDTRIANHARRFADRFVLPTLALGGGVYLATGDVARAVSVIVFDFATGIRVSAPTTVLSTMTAAARRDILVKSGRALEQMARLDTLVFDKTGTLTTGAPVVTDVRALGPAASADEVLVLAAAVERRHTHPAAQAIVRAAERRQLSIPERADSHYTVGLGIAGEVEGEMVLVGNERYLARRGVELPSRARELAKAAGHRGASTVFVAREGRPIGLIAYADVARPEAGSVLGRLHAQGIRNLIMVTGDSPEVAEAIAREVGIDRIEAAVFPERKAEIVRELQRQGRVVGVIGDGINDSPALAYADVAFSLKAGTDVARETAEVVLHGDLHGLPEAIDLARESMRLIRQNLAIVAVPNAAGLALASAGLVGPAMAAALNNGSSVVAAVNSLRPLVDSERPGEGGEAGAARGVA
jgi:Cu2+-exporting ATPase